MCQKKAVPLHPLSEKGALLRSKPTALPETAGVVLTGKNGTCSGTKRMVH